MTAFRNRLSLRLFLSAVTLPSLRATAVCMLFCTFVAPLRPAQLSFADSALYTQKLLAATDDSEFRIQFRGRAPGTSWQEGRECALLKVFVNDRYDQHLFLLGGAEEMTYEFLIGPLSRGEHTLRIEWDNSWSPAPSEKPEMNAFEIHSLDRANRDLEPILRAPILHIRKDTVGKFSDLPLLLYWDIENTSSRSEQVTYTIIFSNEDGGTDTERLMSRWGRTTDIEWCYSYSPSSAPLRENFQGPDHKTLPFRGRKEGWHPILYTATLNNNFTDSLPDAPEFRVRLVPIAANLRGQARESVMDRFPWTYAIMAREMLREGKVEDPADARTRKVSDLRNYAYLEACLLQRGTEIYFEIQLKGTTQSFRSDHGDAKAAIARSGCVRSTVELPPGTGRQDLRGLRIHCRPAPVPEGERPVRSPQASLEAINKLFFLTEDYQPGDSVLEVRPQRALKPGQSLTLPIR